MSTVGSLQTLGYVERSGTFCPQANRLRRLFAIFGGGRGYLS